MPNTVPLVLGLSGLTLVVLSVPLILRKVRPNGFYGFRTPATLNDEQLWYEVNAKTGIDLLLNGAGLLAIVAAHAFGWVSDPLFLALALSWTMLGGLAALVHGFVIIGRR